MGTYTDTKFSKKNLLAPSYKTHKKFDHRKKIFVGRRRIYHEK